MTKLSKILFFFFFTIYLLFPNEIKDLGIGPSGMRILFLDVFVLSIIIINIPYIISALVDITRIIPFWVIVLFILSIVISLLRGLPLYGGFSIGEGRWFLSSILLVIGFSFYDDDIIEIIKKIIYFTAIFQSIIILYRLIFIVPINLEENAIRFGTGRQSFIIYLASIFLIIDLILDISLNKIRKYILLLFFLLIIIISQTRTVFVLFPVVSMIILIITNKLNKRFVFKLTFYLFSAFIISIIFIQLFVKSKIENSIKESIGVVTEIFDPSTYDLIMNPGQIVIYANDFSKFGNTLWRAYAWGQTFQQINNTELGWVLGLPMGSGYMYYSPSGNFIKNLEPHNDYISIISKIGLIGFFCFIIITIYYFRNFLRLKARIMNDKETFQNSLIIFTTILSILLFSLTNDEIRTYGIFFWIWIFLGFGFRFIYEQMERV